MRKDFVKKAIVFAVALIISGVFEGVSNFQVTAAPSEQEEQGIAVIKENVQSVSTSMLPFKYKNIILQKGIPVKWTITAKASDLNGCNNPIVLPEFKIKRKLTVGENVIEFTPKEEGDFLYTCWMGMLEGKIKVVSDIKKVSAKELQKKSSPNQFFKKN